MALYSPHVVLDYMNLHSILNLVNVVKLAETLTTIVLLSFANNVHQMVLTENNKLAFYRKIWKLVCQKTVRPQ